MIRNSTTLFLVSPGATTPIPWVNGEPDFSGFTEPTLSVLQNSWQQFLDSGTELEIVPDPEPVEEIPPPQWENFNFYLLTHPSFVAYGLGVSSANPFLVPGIVERYGKVADVGVSGSGFGAYWNYFCQALEVTTEHRNEWANQAQEFNLPVDFVSVIRGQP
jgi:hypothetical protein